MKANKDIVSLFIGMAVMTAFVLGFLMSVLN